MNPPEPANPGDPKPAEHEPVLLDEVMTWLNVNEGGYYADLTVGAAGHAQAIAERLTTGRLLAVDRDPKALDVARERLERFGDKVLIRQGNFAEIESLHRASGLPRLNGIVVDLGLSSMQLADTSRGFSFNADGPLDMRADPAIETSAADLVNYSDERELADLIFRLGEEHRSRPIARAIMRARPLRTATELAQVVTRAIPSRPGPHQIHPATRTFMALRLAVNRELENLAEFLERVLDVLAPGGRLATIAFHSLEDRIVKQTFAAWHREGRAKVLTRHVVKPGDDEVRRNPRARSARMRVAEKAGGEGESESTQ